MTISQLYQSDRYPFGMQIQERVYTSSSKGYRFGFNGKEKDIEGLGGGGSTYDYGFRNYNAQLGKFLSVDPLFKSYPWYTPYQFAGNMPISAIDLDGLESKIVIIQENSNGSQTVTTTDYKVVKKTILVTSLTGGVTTAEIDIDQKGPLGIGTYTIIKRNDGTFIEKWEPGKGNSVNAFEENGVSQSRWIEGNQSDAKLMLYKRLSARLIEAMVEDMIYDEQGKSLPKDATPEQKKDLLGKIQNHIVVLETDNNDLKGKFASFTSEEVGREYIKNWSPRIPSDNHGSNQAYNSEEFKNSNVIVDYYDGAESNTDQFVPHIGLILEGSFDHILETVPCIMNGECNLGLDNASRVKRYQEKPSN